MIINEYEPRCSGLAGINGWARCLYQLARFGASVAEHHLYLRPAHAAAVKSSAHYTRTAPRDSAATPTTSPQGFSRHPNSATTPNMTRAVGTAHWRQAVSSFAGCAQYLPERCG